MKKKHVLTALALLTAMALQAQYQQAQPKGYKANAPLETFAAQRRTLWNFDWQFQLVTKENKDADFASPSLDDSQWRTLDLPHDFQMEQPWTKDGGGARGFKPMCEGWYRKTFVADMLWRGKQVTLDLGGIIYHGDVYLNGHKIASTEYGYVGLEANLTPHLKLGEKNVVAVYASTGPKKGSRWYTGGGLFRDVYLEVKNPTHIARHGVFITTKDNREVNIQAEVTEWQGHNVTLTARITDADGMVVATTTADMPRYERHTTVEVPFPTITLSNPHLWSLDTPYLYSADVLVYDEGMLVDSVCQQFGVRTLDFSPEFGFRLNGQKVFLQGNAGHHDLGALGAASYERAIERMMLRLKSFGYNCIRCSHNPYSESFTRVADRVGMLIVDELIDKWSDKDYWGGRQPFTHVWPGLIMEWVKRDRNSPSVILWSLGNELQVMENWTGYQGLNDWGVTMYRVMDSVVKRFDPIRLTTVAQFPARAGAIGHRAREYKDYTVPPELAQATDVASLNYQSAWYDEFYHHCPDLNIFQSEAETSNLLAPYYNMQRDRSIGMAFWGSIEYWGESNSWPKKGWNYSFFDHTMQPYAQAWLVKSAFIEHEPTVRVGVLDVKGGESVDWNDIQVGRVPILDHWNFPDSSLHTLMVYTNAPQAELIVNGRSLGTKPNDGTDRRRNTITWTDVDYGRGGSIVAIARDADGREVARHQIETAGKAVRLNIEAENIEWKADGMDLLYLNVTATDSKGRIVPSFAEPLTVTVSGPATILALDNGDHYTDELFRDVTTKRMRGGRMQVILRSQRKAGQVSITTATAKMKKTYKTENRW